MRERMISFILSIVCLFSCSIVGVAAAENPNDTNDVILQLVENEDVLAVVTDEAGNVVECLDVEVTSEIVSTSRAVGSTYAVTYSASYKTDSNASSLSGVVATATVTWNDILGMKNELVSVSGGWTANGETLSNRKVSYGSKSFFGETYTLTKNPVSNNFYYSPSNITGYTLYVNTSAIIESTGKTISLYVKSKITT